MERTENWLGLAGRIAVVTGAGGGLGRAIAATLATAGARLVLLDRDAIGCEEAAAALRARGAEATAMKCDVTDPEDVAAAADHTAATLGPCQVLVNNAGLLRPGPIASLTLEEWNRLISVNLTGYFLCAKAFGRQMLERKQGAIVHVASIAGRHPQPWSGAYSVSKAGVVMLARQLALEWGPSGVRSNVVSPGLVRTPMTDAYYRIPEVAERRAGIVPLRRVASPQDIADLVAFLASDRAGYVNGEDVCCDGGFGRVLMGLVPRPGFEPRDPAEG
ncbi:MAG: SDR family oxidoreductase [Rhodospirillales bacterium]|nr:SDR family oxidoreductase [Rhodospirillales bacterium]